MVVMLAGLAAAAASTPSAGDGISGSSQSFSVLLDDVTLDDETRVVALLDAQVEVADNGQVDLTTFFDDSDVGQVRISIESEVIGTPTEADVLDPVAQPQVTVGVAAFSGCDGLSACEETFIIRFARLEADVTNPIEFEWELDGFVSLLDPEADVTGSLTFTPE